MKLQTSERAKAIPFQQMAPIFNAAMNASNEGYEVYNLSIGQPTHAAPKAFFDGLRKYSQKYVPYGSPSGELVLRKSWTHSLSVRHDACLSPQNMIITNGASEAVSLVMAVACETDEHLLVFNPSYLNYLGMSSLTGVKLLPVERNAENQFKLDEDEVRIKLKSSKCRGILMSNPENPTGKVWSKEELYFLNSECKALGKFLIVDEVYREFVYGDTEISTLLPSINNSEHIIILDSLSKQFGLCGSRIGSIITANKAFMEDVTTFAATRLCGSIIEQHAAAEMLDKVGNSYTATAVQKIFESLTAVNDSINEDSRFKAFQSQGGIFMMIGLPIDNAWKLADFLINDFSVEGKKILISPASSFYFGEREQGANQIRMTLTLPPKDTVNAIEILKLGTQNYIKQQI